MKSGIEQIRSQLLEGIDTANSGGRRRGAPALLTAAAIALLAGLGALAWFSRDSSEPTDVVANDPQPTTQPTVAPTEQPTPSPTPLPPAVERPSRVLDVNGHVIANPATETAMDPDTAALLWEVQRGVEQVLILDPGDQRFSTGGLTVETTLDAATQQQLVEASQSVRSQYAASTQYAISGLAVEPSTGAIRAILPLPGSEDAPNITVQQNVRQPGSLFQPIALAHALEIGYLPDDQVDGRGPCSFPDEGEAGTAYEVENFGNSPGQVASIRDQTLSSNNCWPVRLGLESGNDRMLVTGQRLGLTSPHFPVAAMPMGVWEVGATEMATVYNTFANSGNRVRPYLIQRVLGPEGDVLYDATVDPDREATAAVDAQVACLVTEVLADNVQRGTGAAVRAPMGPQPTAGKTGSKATFEDAWFAGYTPYLTTTIWMGDPLGRSKITVAGTEVTGGFLPAEVFGRFNAAFHQDLPVAEFPTCAAPTRSDTFRAVDFVTAVQSGPEIEAAVTAVAPQFVFANRGFHSAPVESDPVPRENVQFEAESGIRLSVSWQWIDPARGFDPAVYHPSLQTEPDPDGTHVQNSPLGPQATLEWVDGVAHVLIANNAGHALQTVLYDPVAQLEVNVIQELSAGADLTTALAATDRFLSPSNSSATYEPTRFPHWPASLPLAEPE